MGGVKRDPFLRAGFRKHLSDSPFQLGKLSWQRMNPNSRPKATSYWLNRRRERLNFERIVLGGFRFREFLRACAPVQSGETSFIIDFFPSFFLSYASDR